MLNGNQTDFLIFCYIQNELLAVSNALKHLTAQDISRRLKNVKVCLNTQMLPLVL